MRDPSIHIRRSDLEKLLKVIDPEFKDIDWLFKEARKVSCDNRSVSVTNDKVKKDLKKRLQSTKGDANLLSDIIYSVRVKLKHRGLKKINEGDREWLQLKELSKLCNQFCEDFELSKRAGYIAYIQICFSKISSFRAYISKFISMYESICIEYEYKKSLDNDDNKSGTKFIHDYFVTKIADKTGIHEPYYNNIIKMFAFYKARLLCDQYNVSYEDFIDAQFEALDWCQGMPSPESLNTDKSKERLQKYLYENNIKTKKGLKQEDEFWQQLKSRGSK